MPVTVNVPANIQTSTCHQAISAGSTSNVVKTIRSSGIREVQAPVGADRAASRSPVRQSYIPTVTVYKPEGASGGTFNS